MKNILFFVFALLLWSCSSEQPQETETSKVKPENLSLTTENLENVKLVPVQYINDSDDFNVVGDLSFDEDNVVRVFPIVSGSVEKVAVSLGDYVKKGDLLAIVVSTDISTYQREYNVAKNNLATAEKELERLKELFKTNVASQRELDAAQREYENAKAEFSEKKQILELYGSSTKDNDAVFKVYAPNSGYIVERNINEGMQIRTDNATNIFTISDLKTIWVWGNVYESDMGKIKEGDKVYVTTIAYPDRVFESSITKIGTVLDAQSRVVRIRTELPNTEGLLKPEMFATIKISPTRNNKILAVPTKAIVIENSKFWVMKEIADKKFEKVEIRTGKTVREYTQVLSGVQENDKIVVEGSLFVLTAYNQR